MSTIIDRLLASYEKALKEPWGSALSGQERVWFLVYDPAEQRKIDLHLGMFETTTLQQGKKWVAISMKKCFPEWMAKHEYKESYFEDPETLVDQLEINFKPYAIDFLASQMKSPAIDDNTVVAIRDVSALFGFLRLSEALNVASAACRGRMLVFFPGEFQKNQYRLLDARDGWSYLARPITL